MRNRTATILLAALRGATFRLSGRGPTAFALDGAGQRLALLLFLLAGTLRRCAVDGAAPGPALAETALVGAVLLAVSAAGLWAELMLVLCSSIGVSLLATLACTLGLADAGGGPATVWPLAWELAAVFVALMRFRLGGLAMPDAPAR